MGFKSWTFLRLESFLTFFFKIDKKFWKCLESWKRYPKFSLKSKEKKPNFFQFFLCLTKSISRQDGSKPAKFTADSKTIIPSKTFLIYPYRNGYFSNRIRIVFESGRFKIIIIIGNNQIIQFFITKYVSVPAVVDYLQNVVNKPQRSIPWKFWILMIQEI